MTRFAQFFKKYYTRENNRIVFCNGMTLNQLAITMWEQLGYKGMDASALSRIIKGERLFTFPQLEKLCITLDLKRDERNELFLTLKTDYLNRHGLNNLYSYNFSDDLLQQTVIYSQEEVIEPLTSIEESDGDRYVVISGLSVNTVPISIMQERSQNCFKRGDKKSIGINERIKCYQRRKNAFLNQVKKSLFREVCPKSIIQQYVRNTSEFASADMLINLGCNPETKREKRDHLKALINLLEDNSNYELALIDDTNIHWFFNRNFWGIKGDTLILESWFSKTQGRFLMINESIIVKSFRNNFLQLWEDLPTENKDKECVIGLLKEQINCL